MKKIKIIFGPQESGKSFLSRQIMLGYDNPLFINGRALKHPKEVVFEFHELSETTDIIVIDDLKIEYLLDYVKEFSREEIRVNRKFKPEIRIIMPRILINLETACLPEDLKKYNVEAIEALTWIHSTGKLIFEANIIS